MDYERLLALVEQDPEIGRERAEGDVRATLQTLAERISAGRARDLAEQLPAELAPWLATAGGAERALRCSHAGRESTSSRQTPSCKLSRRRPGRDCTRTTRGAPPRRSSRRLPSASPAARWRI
jgi:Uncharacterized conserved protein (DUF2267)